MTGQSFMGIRTASSKSFPAFFPLGVTNLALVIHLVLELAH
jgi:hypothetical protein